MKKNNLFLRMALALLLLVSSSLVAIADDLSVALVLVGQTHPFHIAEGKGAREAGRRLGVDVKVISGEDDQSKQINAFENALLQKPDAIGVIPVLIDSLKPTFEKAVRAGIPIVTIHSTAEEAVAQVGYDELKTGSDIANYAINLLKEKYGQAKGKVAILGGGLGQRADTLRTQGFVQVIEQYENIKIVDRKPTDWDPNKAMEVTENYLTAYPDLDLLYALDDGIAIAAANVIRRAGKSSQIDVIGVGGLASAFDAIRKGDLTATYLLAAEYSGFKYAETLIDVARGGINFKEERLIKGILVTADNLNAIEKLVLDMDKNINDFPFEKDLAEIVEMYSK